MYQLVAATAAKYIDANASVGVALSGGADSVVLCDILIRVCAERGAALTCLHFEHGMRGDESMADAAFVGELCRKRGIPCAVGHAVPGALKSEQDARTARYAFFDAEAAKRGLSCVFLAHHADDRIETMLLNIIRGCGISGLHPMPEHRGLFVRPMLAVSRSEIEAYAVQNGLSYVTDSTNLSREYARNIVRNSILPEVRGINPGFTACAQRLMASAAADDDCLLSAARAELHSAHRGCGMISIDKGRFAALHPAVAGRLVRLAVRELSTLTDVGQAHIDAVAALASLPSGSHADLKNGLCARSGFDTVDICVGRPTASYNAAAERIDGDRLPEGCVMRAPQTGDYIVPLGMSGKKLLKDYLREKKIPRELRAELTVYAAGSEVYAVPGVGISDKVRITDDTKNIIQL